MHSLSMFYGRTEEFDVCGYLLEANLTLNSQDQVLKVFDKEDWTYFRNL